MPRVGIVICSRLGSSRLKNKAHILIENRTVISHLVHNLKDIGLPVVVAVPHSDFHAFSIDTSFPRQQNILIYPSEFADDPLARTHQVAKQFEFDYVVRVTHDKIFIDTESLKEAIKIAINQKAEYVYCPHLIAGTGFEVINYRALSEAANRYDNVEFIGYAIRNVSKNTISFSKCNNYLGVENVSLLLDYEDDLKLFQVIYSNIGVNSNFVSALMYLSKNSNMCKINRKPLISVYTCAYNSQEFLLDAIKSVFDQSIFNLCEYILIDDCSTDATFEIMASAHELTKNYNYIRNQRNIGLSSSSNIALSKARGKYIIRIDSDDYFSNENSLKELYEYAEATSAEMIYPNNYFGSFDIIQHGKDSHHVGGALFNKNALNFIKFTDGLRGYEGYDLFLRAKDRLKVGYYEKPCFFYTQRQGSMSTTNPKFRRKIKTEIETRLKVRT